MTGSPAELLDPDLDLEADLGVDTVKQAEVFAAVRERFNLERDENLQLRDFPTLRHVVGWVTDKRATARPQPTPAAAPESAAPAADAPPAYPRRIAVPVLRPPATSFPPSSVELRAGSRVIVMLDEGGVGKRLVERLKKLQVTALTLSVGVPTTKLSSTLQRWLK